MIAGEIISEDIYPVKPSDKIRVALDRMQENHIGQLPVVKNSQFLGLLNDHDIASKPEKTFIKSIEFAHELIFAYENQHIYDVIRLFYVHQLDVLPVLTEKYGYIGVITLRGIIDHMTLLTGSGET